VAVFAIVNQKGGVGKTTTAVNLAACLGAAGRRVLLVDMDAQGNATSGLGLENFKRTVYEVLLGRASALESVCATPFEGVYGLPATSDLAGAEVELVQMRGRERKLKDALAGINYEFDYIILDCPPSLGMLTLNALVAADKLIVPVQAHYYPLEGLGVLIDVIERVRSVHNERLRMRVLLTMMDGSTLSKQVEDEVRGFFAREVYETVIWHDIRLAEAPSFGKPIIYYALRSRGADAYIELAKEVMADEEGFGKRA